MAIKMSINSAILFIFPSPASLITTTSLLCLLIYFSDIIYRWRRHSHLDRMFLVVIDEADGSIDLFKAIHRYLHFSGDGFLHE